MTLPVERKRAVNHAREFLYELMDPSKTPRVPRSVRDRARAVLRHYPSGFDMDHVAEMMDTNDKEGVMYYKVFGNAF